MRTYSDNERREAKARHRGPKQSPAARGFASELSGNKSVVASNTFLFKGGVPALVSINKVLYSVNPIPINNGKIIEQFDAILINTQTRLVYTAKISEIQKLSCLYFETKSAQ